MHLSSSAETFRFGKILDEQSSCEGNQLSIGGIRKELSKEYANGIFPVTMP